MKFIYSRASKKLDTCIKPAETAHSYTHSYMSHKTIKKKKQAKQLHRIIDVALKAYKCVGIYMHKYSFVAPKEFTVRIVDVEMLPVLE